MPEAAPNPELLSSLGRLVRGLSALFWGIPVALVVSVQTARADWLRPLGIVPPLLATATLLYGLRLVATFQKQERVWQVAVERAQMIAFFNCALSPFIYWWSRLPAQPFFNLVFESLVIGGVSFLYFMNPLLRRLTAMLPDETLRHEARGFTGLNRVLLLTTLVLVVTFYVLEHVNPHWEMAMFNHLMRTTPVPQSMFAYMPVLERVALWLTLFLILLPVATTMALLWKTKEVILTSIFGPQH